MRILYVFLAICLATAVAIPPHDRIVGGSVTNINNFPFAAVLLRGPNNVNFRQDCGGTIINNRSILSAAHCWVGRGPVSQFRVRVGSTNANSGGTVHNVAQHITHPSYNVGTFMNNDIGIVRVATAIAFGNSVRVGSIAGANHNVADNQNVWAIGWGLTSWGGSLSEQLRQVQLRIVNQARCQSIYGTNSVNANMICAGWDVNGRGTCTGDSGGPLLHNNVVVGLTSWGTRCGEARFPGVYARVSRFTNWVRSNA